MADELKNTLALTTKVYVPEISRENFIDWQSRFKATISTFPGFVSLEMSSPRESTKPWLIIQQFSSTEWVNHWRNSKERQSLMDDLKKILPNNALNNFEDEFKIPSPGGGITEVFVTQVAEGKEKAYQEWSAKIHSIEARFPGFRGIYLQAPTSSKSNIWITLLQFDTQEHLDKWLSSSERIKILDESTQFVASLESHRLISPFAGWFSSIAPQPYPPPVWKQTMVVLLVLFPIVMLELQYLRTMTEGLGLSLATFISNAISVSLISWPLMPFAVGKLKWWLQPLEQSNWRRSFLGITLILILYLIEIFFFW